MIVIAHLLFQTANFCLTLFSAILIVTQSRDLSETSQSADRAGCITN